MQIKNFHEEKIKELERAAGKDPKYFWKVLWTSSDDIETNIDTKNMPANNDQKKLYYIMVPKR